MWMVSPSARGRVVSASAKSRACCGFATAGAEIGRPAYIVACRRRGADGIVTFSGRDSDLEAFSHNPSDGSVAPLAYQPST